MRPTAYRRNARGLRDRQAFERVRLQAGELFAAVAPRPWLPASSLKAAREMDEQLAAVGSTR
jgi:hypothetical protein